MIKQGRVSKTIYNVNISGSVDFNFLEKYNLEKYKNPRESAVFFGCYNPPEDFATIMNHKGLGIVIWLGTDIQIINPRKLRQMRQKSNIKHIAETRFIAHDLKKIGIKFKRLAIYSGENIPDPQTLGDHIYCYAPKVRYNFYGGKIIDQLKRFLPNEKFIITLSHIQYSKEQLIKVYKKSFIGLRLTNHDGIPHTVVELGLMGRRCIFNDILPNTIPWRNIQDIIKIIKTEKLMIGQTNIQLANAMANFLNIGDSWLQEKYWQ